MDTFVVSSDAKDGVNAMKFMETIADPKTSLEFNKVKGSVPIRERRRRGIAAPLSAPGVEVAVQ